MANKKISQLAGTLPREIVSGEYLFPAAAGNAGAGYETKKITAQEIAEFVFTGYGGVGFPATQLSGTKNVYLNNSNWINSTATQPPNYGFLMLRTSDGLLTTGSGIGTPVDGDNLGDHTATQSLNMQGNDITSADDINFQSSTSRISRYNTNNENLLVKAHSELTLQANKHVFISGDALSLASIPISGAIDASLGITFTGGNVEIDPANKLIVNEIDVVGGTATNDSGVLTIRGASRHDPYDINSLYTPDEDASVYWNESNIQFAQVDGSLTAPKYDFRTITHGQTLTMYVEHTAAANTQTVIPAFVSGSESAPSNVVLWGGTGGPPFLAANRTNVYTFAGYNGVIFASAITGYVY